MPIDSCQERVSKKEREGERKMDKHSLYVGHEKDSLHWCHRIE